MTITDWQIVSQTHCGNVRKVNEDSVLAQKAYPLLAIADGMGGHEAGDIASQMLISDLAALDLDRELQTAADQVNRSILSTNESIIDYSKRNLNGQTVGTTVVAMLSSQSKGVCLWAGDSRLYRLKGDRLEQLTQDHSYVAELVRTGQLQPEDIINHPNANIITRTVGAEPSLSLDFTSFIVNAQDTYLLCSDGLYNEVDNEELLQAMQSPDIYRASIQLLNLCLNRTAKDNVSFIIARAIEENTEPLDSTLTTLA